ncbi:MAG: hypothetical protein WBG23_00190 [Acidobacteriaceae bacterium]|jgi:hypothetical protein
MTRNSAGDRILWGAVDIVSGMLAPTEREAVRGDLIESGETGNQALLAVLGLLCRRQAALWSDWRPWLVLAGLVLPLGTLLSLVSRNTASSSAIDIWFYANNWDWNLLSTRGFWYGFAECVPGFLISNLALVCWSWTSGFLLASLSRRTIWLNGALFCLMLLSGGSLGGPWLLGPAWIRHLAPGFDPNRVVFALSFYRVLYPLIVQAVLVFLPFVWGIRQSLRLGEVSLAFRAIIWVPAFATLATLVTQDLVWWQLRVWTIFPLRYPRLPSLLPFAVLGPAAYLLATAIWRRRQHHRIDSQ